MNKLLVITNIYPPQNLGGFGICIERLTQGLVRIGYKAIVLTSNEEYLGKADGDEDIVRELKLLGSYQNGVKNLEEGEERQKRREQNKRIVKAIVGNHKPNACLIGNLDLLGKEILDTLLDYDIPTIQHIGFMGSPFPGDWIPKGKKFKLAFASGEARRKMVAMGHRVQEDPIVYPPLPVSMENSGNTKKNQENNINIGYCGLIMQSKGLHLLLEAVYKLKEIGVGFNLKIAGDEFSREYKQSLKLFCESNGLEKHIEWVGFIEPNKLNAFYRDIDVFVFPSIYPESFGMVTAEAMSNGVMPITSGVGGAIEVVTHGVDGLLMQPENSSDLYEKLLWCCKNRVKVSKMGEKAKQTALKRFSIEQGAKILHENFNNLKGADGVWLI